jgi:hypothetical protein
MTTTFAIEQPMTGLFEFVCLALLKPLATYPSFADAEQALAEHSTRCDECALTGAFVEPKYEKSDLVVVPNSVARLVLSPEELSRNMYKFRTPAVDAEDLLGRTILAGAMVNESDAEVLSERIQKLSDLALKAYRSGFRVFWE